MLMVIVTLVGWGFCYYDQCLRLVALVMKSTSRLRADHQTPRLDLLYRWPLLQHKPKRLSQAPVRYPGLNVRGRRSAEVVPRASWSGIGNSTDRQVQAAWQAAGQGPCQGPPVSGIYLRDHTSHRSDTRDFPPTYNPRVDGHKGTFVS